MTRETDGNLDIRIRLHKVHIIEIAHFREGRNVTGEMRNVQFCLVVVGIQVQVQVNVPRICEQL